MSDISNTVPSFFAPNDSLGLAIWRTLLFHNQSSLKASASGPSPQMDDSQLVDSAEAFWESVIAAEDPVIAAEEPVDGENN